MSAFFLALIASFALALGARDQLLVAHLRTKLGGSAGLLLVAVASSALTAALAAYVGMGLGTRLAAGASNMFVAIALLVAAVELAWPWRRKLPEEPTRSLVATFVVLFVGQITDAARFLVLALAVALASPQFTALGGAAGGAAAVTMGWVMGADLQRLLPLRTIRLVLAAVLLVAAVVTGLSVRGII